MTHCRQPFNDCTSLCERCERADRLAEINNRTRRAMAATAAQSIALAAVSFILIFTAGYWGLSRAERAYQIEARV